MDYIEISGYKSIYQQRIDFESVNLLVGSNGSGKSNFLSFFDLLKNLYNQNLRQYIALNGRIEKVLYNGSKVTNLISFKIEFDNGKNGYQVLLQKGLDNFVFRSEKLFYQQDDGVEINNFAVESTLKHDDSYRARYVIKYLEGFKKYHFHDTGKDSPFAKPSHIIKDIHFLYSNGSNLAAFLFFIKVNHRLVYNRIVKMIQSIAPFFLDFELIIDPDNYIHLLWKDRYSENLYGVTDLSDGTLRFIALVTLFQQPKLPDTIIIDEPELGLHPAAISKLAGMIHSAATRGCQVIIATQSTDLISYFTPESIITTDLINGRSVFKRLNSRDLEQWLEDYTIDDLWKRNIITTGQPNF